MRCVPGGIRTLSFSRITYVKLWRGSESSPMHLVDAAPASGRFLSSVPPAETERKGRTWSLQLNASYNIA